MKTAPAPVERTFPHPCEADQPAGAATSLDTKGISVKGPESLDNSQHLADLLAWRALVLVAVEGWKERQARHLEALGRRHYAERLRELEGACVPGTCPTPPPCESTPEGWTVSRWHAQRAKGLREWAARLALCGREENGLHLWCGECGAEHVLPVGCGVEALCHGCRDRRAREWRKEFDEGRQLLEELTAERRLDRAIHGRLMTLTAPDVGPLEERIVIRAAAWRRFSKRLSAWFVEESERLARITGTSVETIRGLIHYMRVEEWTPGTDHAGHPHFHVWLHSPYLPHQEIRDGWRRDVIASARELQSAHVGAYEAQESYQIDIRIAGSDVSKELIKYLVKDWLEGGPDGEAKGLRIAPAMFARLVQANAGRRRRQCSRGFREYCRAGKQPPQCRECGSQWAPSGVRQVEVTMVRVDRRKATPCDHEAPPPGCEERRGPGLARCEVRIESPDPSELPHVGQQTAWDWEEHSAMSWAQVLREHGKARGP